MSRILVQNIIVIASLFLVPACVCEVSPDIWKFNYGTPTPIQPTNTQVIPTQTIVPTEAAKRITDLEVLPKIPTTTQTLVPTTTQTATATVTTAPACLIPLSPPDASSYGSFGEINFSWDANVDAASYAVVVTAPNGTVMTFPADSTEYTRWIESFSWGGEFTWQVLALDADGNVLCRSETLRFTKPVTEPSQTAVPRGKKPTIDPMYIPTI